MPKVESALAGQIGLGTLIYVESEVPAGLAWQE
jgi:hypothetical protein